MRFPRLGIVTILAWSLIGSCVTTQPKPTSSDYNRGQSAARESIARDHLVFLDPFGIVRADTEEHRAFLRERFGIGYKLDRGVTADFADGFNSTMDAEARDRFGDRYAAAFVEQKYPELGPVRVKPIAEQGGDGDA
ncbi:hypothetical protein HNR46_004276 [Haloferula luteola]|uniref:Uncharacterized protein n=1 Tax=Haloferula luteola TaxID=595692 RepID=A0A840VES4_9BACT|nr:hypothetical protein [Haloferula luteola]MBB5354004.1 hypothetical protein [Haloferula luteola]